MLVMVSGGVYLAPTAERCLHQTSQSGAGRVFDGADATAVDTQAQVVDLDSVGGPGPQSAEGVDESVVDSDGIFVLIRATATASALAWTASVYMGACVDMRVACSLLSAIRKLPSASSCCSTHSRTRRWANFGGFQGGGEAGGACPGLPELRPGWTHT